MTEYIKNPLSGKLRGVTYEDGKIIDVHIRDTDDVVKVFVPVRHGRWECIYDDRTGETDITCSHCKNTRTINGCFVTTDGKSCYFEDDYCPNCGAKMDGNVEWKEGVD